MGIFRPGKPWRIARLSADLGQPIGAHELVFDSVTGDGEWAPGGQAVVAVPGLYLASLSVGKTATGSATALTVRIECAGVRIGVGSGPSGTAATRASCTGLVMAEEGDAIVPWSNVAVANTSLAADECQFSVVRIGPVRWT